MDEIAKLLKYILFAILVSHLTLSQGQPIITEPQPFVSIPFYHSEGTETDIISSFTENKHVYRHGVYHGKRSDPDLEGEHVERNSGGHKETRQVPNHPEHSLVSMQQSGPPGPGSQNGPRRYSRNDGLSSLCSIFRTFLDPRRFPRCHVSNVEHSANSYFDRSNGPNANELISEGNLEQRSQREREQQQRQRNHDEFINRNGPSSINSDGASSSDLSNPSTNLGGPSQPDSTQSLANKRYDHLEDAQINHSGEEDDDQILGGSGPGGPRPPPPHQDPTKISQDRTMIVVPERQCPQGQRRDPRGYCRRIVKIRTSYQQYGPPQGVVRPIPIRYYYSRIVTIPALHFFFPS
jgi:hypothetical protein